MVQESTLPPAAASTDERRSAVTAEERPDVQGGQVLIVDLSENERLLFQWIPSMKVWAGKYEVTNGQFRKFKPGHSSGKFGGQSLNDDNQPAVRMTWLEAHEFCRWLNHQYGDKLPQGMSFRIPSVKEWFLLARCGARRRYAWGDSWPPAYGNFSDLTATEQLKKWEDIIPRYSDGYAVTSPVERSGANDWGLFGMAGNAWEWCNEWYDNAKKKKLRCGGAWDTSSEKELRLLNPGSAPYKDRQQNTGLRLIVSGL